MADRDIYMDFGATTPVAPEVVEVMLPYWTDYFGNPSAAHLFGQKASAGLQQAREMIAQIVNCDLHNVIFTASGSESDNLALRGVMWSARMAGGGNHLIISAIEHKAVSETAFHLKRTAGFDVTVLPVDKYGQINLGQLKDAISKDTVLISIMAANNEIGTIQPIKEIGQIARDQGILFHTDAVQAIAVTDLDFGSTPIDLMSLAPHKFYGPKGIGILVVKHDISLEPVITGGGQENEYRAGTENVAYALGAAEALRLAFEKRESNINHYQQLTRSLTARILNAFPESCQQTGHPSYRIPNNASFTFKQISGNDIVFHLSMAGIGASSGSACLVGDPKPSKVLQAIGLDSDWTKGGLRLTVGESTTKEDIEVVLNQLYQIIPRLERLRNQFA